MSPDPLRNLVLTALTGMHRCLVFDAEDPNRFAPKLLTQTDIVRFLLSQIKHSEELQASLHNTLSKICNEPHAIF
jgi:hypothetical protein